MRRSAMAALALLAACGGEAEGPPAREPSSLWERPCDDEALDWETFGEPFLRSWCTGCHSSDLAGDERRGAPPGSDFDTLAGVRAWRERIWARAADANETMPPVAGPSAEERRRLGAWLACGAP